MSYTPGVLTTGQATKVYTGTFSTTATLLQVVFNIPHGLGFTPSYANVAPETLGAAGPCFWTCDATNIVVTMVTAPGIVAVAFRWAAIQ